MTQLDTSLSQSIQQALAIIEQGRALERLFIAAGFTLPASETQPATPPEPTAEPKPLDPEWPKRDPDSAELVDVRGIAWIEAAHSANQTCNADGTWRRKRGVDPEETERLEAEQLRPKPEPAPETTAADASTPHDAEPEPETNSAITEFDKIRAGLEAARDPSELKEWFDYSSQVIISQSQRYALEAIAADRERQWANRLDS